MTSRLIPLDAPAGTRRILFATGIGFSLVGIDASAVTVAVNPIASGFGAGLDGVHWMLVSAVMVIAALTIPFGVLADRKSPRSVFLFGLVAFPGASLVSAVSVNVPMLVGSRALQGVGAAALISSSVAYLAVAYGDTPGRAPVVAAWTALGVIVASLGTALGGLLAALDWRLVFLPSVPLALLAFLLIQGTPRIKPIPTPDAPRPDYVWQVLGAISLVGIVGGVIEGIGTESIPAAMGMICVGVVAFAAVVWRIARHRQLESVRTLLCTHGYRTGFVANTYASFVIAALPASVSVYLASTLGWSIQTVGLALLPIGLTSALMRTVSGRLMSKFGPQRLIVTGACLTAVAFGLLGASSGTPSYQPLILAVLIGSGFGSAFMVPAATAVMVQATPDRMQGTGSGVLNATRQATLALGIATFGAFADVIGSVGEAFLYIGLVGCLASAATAVYISRAGSLEGATGTQPDYV